MLDNCDGKQARKTGNASTLGLLFDHGCDLLNLLLNTMTVLRIMSVCNYMFFVYLGVTGFTFFFTTLEQ